MTLFEQAMQANRKRAMRICRRQAWPLTMVKPVAAYLAHSEWPEVPMSAEGVQALELALAHGERK